LHFLFDILRELIPVCSQTHENVAKNCRQLVELLLPQIVFAADSF